MQMLPDVRPETLSPLKSGRSRPRAAIISNTIRAPTAFWATFADAVCQSQGSSIDAWISDMEDSSAFTPGPTARALCQKAEIALPTTQGDFPLGYNFFLRLIEKAGIPKTDAVKITNYRGTPDDKVKVLNWAYDWLIENGGEARPSVAVAAIGFRNWGILPTGQLYSFAIPVSEAKRLENMGLTMPIAWYVPSSTILLTQSKLESCKDVGDALGRPGLFDAVTPNEKDVQECIKEAKMRGLSDSATEADAIFRCVARNACTATGIAGARPFMPPFFPKRAKFTAETAEGITSENTQGIYTNNAAGVSGCCARSIRSVGAASNLFSRLVKQSGTMTVEELEEMLKGSKLPEEVKQSMRKEQGVGYRELGKEFEMLLAEVGAYWGARPEDINAAISISTSFQTTDFASDTEEENVGDITDYAVDTMEKPVIGRRKIRDPRAAMLSLDSDSEEEMKSKEKQIKPKKELSEIKTALVQTGTRLVGRILQFVLGVLRWIKNALANALQSVMNAGLIKSGVAKLDDWAAMWREEASAEFGESTGIISNLVSGAKLAAGAVGGAIAFLAKFVLWLGEKGFDFLKWILSHPFATRILLRTARVLIRRGCRGLSTYLYSRNEFAVPLSQLTSTDSFKDMAISLSEKGGAIGDIIMAGVQQMAGKKLMGPILKAMGNALGSAITLFSGGVLGPVGSVFAVIWNTIWNEMSDEAQEAIQGSITVFFQYKNVNDLMDILRVLRRCLVEPAPLLVVDSGRVFGRPRKACRRDMDCAQIGCIEVASELAQQQKELLALYNEAKRVTNYRQLKQRLRGAESDIPPPQVYLNSIAVGETGSLTTEQLKVYVALIVRKIAAFDASNNSPFLTYVTNKMLSLTKLTSLLIKYQDDELVPTENEIRFAAENIDQIPNVSETTKSLVEAGYKPIDLSGITKTAACNVCASDGYCWMTHDPPGIGKTLKTQVAAAANTLTGQFWSSLDGYVKRAFGLTQQQMFQAAEEATRAVTPAGNPVLFTPPYVKLQDDYRSQVIMLLKLEKEKAVRSSTEKEPIERFEGVVEEIDQEILKLKALMDVTGFTLSMAGNLTVATPEVKKEVKQALIDGSTREKERLAGKAILKALTTGRTELPFVAQPVSFMTASTMEKLRRLISLDPKEVVYIQEPQQLPLDLSNISVGRE